MEETYHSNAPNATPALAILQTEPKQTLSPRNAARAMKPANQYNARNKSTPGLAYLCAACGNRLGTKSW